LREIAVFVGESFKDAPCTVSALVQCYHQPLSTSRFHIRYSRLPQWLKDALGHGFGLPKITQSAP